MLILPRALALLRDSTSSCWRSAPPGLDLEDVRGHLLGMAGVRRRPRPARLDHHQRLPSLSAHVSVSDDVLAADGVGAVLDRLAACVAEHFDVRHATFQVEPESHREHEDLGEPH